MARLPSEPPSNGASRPVYTDVGGAPFKIGQVVRIHQLVDEEVDPSLLGKQGLVAYLEYSCGCGQSYPCDPMVGVRLLDGSLHEFWKEELKAARPVRAPKPTFLASSRSRNPRKRRPI